jgi:HEXXH motif-containing protein
MTTRHHLAPAEFLALAGGYGGPATICALSRAQRSKHLLLIKYVVEHWAGDPALRDRAVAVLSAAQRADPDLFGDLMTDPLVGAWAAQVTRRLRGTAPMPPRQDVFPPLSTECGHLAAIAAAAAVLTGIHAELTLHTRGGGVFVPRIGRVLVPAAEHQPVAVLIHDGQISVDGAIGRQELYRIRARDGERSIDVMLDDLHPYRGGHHAPPAPRLAPDEAAHWQRVFDEAWALLAGYAPARAAELTAGLRTLVPLRKLDEHSARSATIRDAFGAFGLTRPSTPADLAVMLVHEFQHSKLSGVLDIQPLLDPAAKELHFAPWRTDPRPAGGLMQGVYAFLGIADLWRRLRDCPGLEARAEREFAVVREQLAWALSSLESSAALNAAGRRFTAGMRTAVDALAAEPLPVTVIRQARDAVHGNYDAWQQRNARS